MPAPPDLYQQAALDAAARAYAPYSGRQVGTVLVLADGTWVPGVRVENASFGLTISALLNAYTTLRTAQRNDLVGVVHSHPLQPDEEAFLQATPPGSWTADTLRAWRSRDHPWPTPTSPLNPFLPGPLPKEPEAGLARARRVAEGAFIPESDFPVGCLIATDEGPLVPGVNVEHADWSRILCAERTALSTAVTYGVTPRTVYVSCPLDPTGSPCGACRQVLVEQAAGTIVWQDRGPAPALRTSPEALLPHSFQGQPLRTHPTSTR
ncbi:MAG: cytidine deaminase [Bacteroidota bacterium]